jgi:Ca-activated chloride channel homolog
MKSFKTGWSRFVGVALATVAGVMLAACQPPQSDSSQQAPTSSGPVFRILAGSELKDVADKVTAFGQSQGVTVQLTFTGSLDAVDTLSDNHNFDAVWLSHGKYLRLVPGVKEQVKQSEKTMYSRVVLGVKPEKAKELGWKSGKVTWKEVTADAKSGKFHFAMTNPSGSNSGFVTLVGVASELSGKGDALQEGDIPDGALKDFFSGMTVTSGSSGDLADKFKADISKADAIVNYESVIQGLKQSGVALDVIVPKEGVITADYPLMLLSQSKQADFYAKLVAFLREDSTQDWLAKNTFRSPLKGSGSDEVTNELPFPGNLKVVDAILRGFLDTYSKPATSYFVLDVSGSMEGPRMNDMKASVGALAKGDGSVSGRFSTFRDREVVGITAFSGIVHDLQEYPLTGSAAENSQKLQQAAAYVQSLVPEDSTAIYDALLSVYPRAQAQLKKGDRTVSIVLLTDGENNKGARLNDFLNAIQSMGGPKVPVYGILYGEANSADMQQLTQATGGRMFDARKQSLKKVLKAIRAYQ